MKPEHRVTLGLAIIFLLLLVIFFMEQISSTRQVMIEETGRALHYDQLQ